MWPGNETCSDSCCTLFSHDQVLGHCTCMRRGVDNIHIFMTCRIHSGNFDLAGKGYSTKLYVKNVARLLNMWYILYPNPGPV